MAARAVPEGHHTVAPFLIVRNGVQALDFYKEAFGAEEVYRLLMPDGRLGHAQIRLGDSIVMLTEEAPDHGSTSPETLGGSPVYIHLYVDDVDALFEKAIAAGARERMPPKDRFYGNRDCRLEDPFGHLWWVATHKEDVTPEEMRKRLKVMSEAEE